jgi:hypothetical protein
VIETGAHVEVPSDPAADQAWSMLAAEGGGLAVVLGLAVVALWRVVSKVLSESREQNKALIEAQTKGMVELKDAVATMDKANQIGLARVSDALGHATTRLDRHEVKIDEHGAALHAHDRRIAVLEGAR